MSSSSGLFVGSQTPTAGRVRARDRRGDISSDRLGLSSPRRRQLLVDEHGHPISNEPDSNAATFSNLNPNTSDADALAGVGSKFVWGSNISQAEVLRTIKDFLMNFERRYRMIKEGEINGHDTIPLDHPAKNKEYVEMMETMLTLGVTALNLDLKNLKSYPSTVKLWHQMQDYPDEIIDLFDNTIKDCMIELAEKRMHELRRERTQHGSRGSRLRQSSSIPPSLSSNADAAGNQPAAAAQGFTDIQDLVREVESKVYRVRPFNLDNSINLRDLNPKGLSEFHQAFDLRTHMANRYRHGCKR